MNKMVSRCLTPVLIRLEYNTIDDEIYRNIKGDNEKMVKFNSRIFVSIDENNSFWIVAKNGKIIKNPTKKDLQGTILRRYNDTNICPICREEWKRDGKELTDKSILYPQNTCVLEDKNGKNKWICVRHHQRYNPNSQHNLIKSVADRRTGNLCPNSEQAKGDKGEELLCTWKGYINLNKKFDNYRTRIDCLDENTGEYYQVKIVYYSSVRKRWDQDFTLLQNSISEGYRFKTLYLFCISEDGLIVERLYEIPEKDIRSRSCHIAIYENSINSWYEQCRFTDKDELKKLNDIWKEIINRKT